MLDLLHSLNCGWIGLFVGCLLKLLFAFLLSVPYVQYLCTLGKPPFLLGAI